ncbi:MAG: T9SS type A sorting domain-containing protein [Saprospiraceae bacterium]|nr:T9SS type A sorting domain-containing protein [Candidatus Defluviibacterium haderslevense]
MEKNISSNITVNNIINLSTEHNVLSLYTAFLCLEDTSYYCVNCKDETHINTGTEELIDTTNFISYPNPFSEKIQFTLNDIKNIDPGQVSISIYDISGRKVDIISEFQLIQGSLKFSWHPNPEIQTGIYICIVKAKNSVYKKKIIKM